MISENRTVKLLEITIDDELKFDKHIRCGLYILKRGGTLCRAPWFADEENVIFQMV